MPNQLLLDVNTTPFDIYGAPTSPGRPLDMGGYALFRHTNGGDNVELWRTDGTPGGTFQIKDVNPGHNPSFPDSLVRASNDIAYFRAWFSTSSSNDSRLWRTDGTAAGTYRLADTNPAGDDQIENLATVGFRVYFSACDGIHGQELWTSNGTPGGTHMIRDFTPGSASSGIRYTGSNGSKFFFNIGPTLYITDGTDAGTVSTVIGNVSAPMVLSGGKVFLTTDTNELYCSDGTLAGTVRLVGSVPAAVQMVDSGGTLFYSGGSSTILYRYNPGAGNVTSVTATPRNVNSLTDVDGTLYFSGSTTANGQELYRVTGTGSASIVGDIAAGSASSSPAELTNLGGVLYFRAAPSAGAYTLYQVTGPTAGITAVTALQPVGSSKVPQGFAVFGNALLFANHDSTNGWELWTSDGSAAGTHLIANVNLTTNSSSPINFWEWKGDVYFTAEIDSNFTVRKLFKTDGTTAGTVMVDLAPQLGLDSGSMSGMFAFDADRFFFVGNDPTHGRELWITDGTPAGTHFVRDINQGTGDSSVEAMCVRNGSFYFTANDGMHGTQIWDSDGSTLNTFAISDVNSAGGGGMYGGESAQAGNWIITSGNDGAHGLELFRSDGTTLGTAMLMDIYPGGQTSHSQPHGFTTIGNLVYFYATDPVHGREVWRTDGTPGGTMMVADVNPGSTNSVPIYPNPRDNPFVSYNGAVYFIATSAAVGNEIFRTDGTTAGTGVAIDLVPGAGSSSPFDLCTFNGRLYFEAENQVWSSDGTASGMFPLLPDGLATGISYLTARDGQIFFTARLAATGYFELFGSDGTAAGTHQLGTIGPDPEASQNDHGASSVPYIARGTGAMVLNGSERVHGYEPRVYTDTFAPTFSGASVAFAPAQTMTIFPAESLGASFTRSDLTLQNLTTSQFVDPNLLGMTYDPNAGSDGGRATVTFAGVPGGKLADGTYRLTIPAGSVTDAAGNASTAPFVFDFLLVSSGDHLALTGATPTKVNQVVIGAGGTLDVGTSTLIVDYLPGAAASPLDAITSLIAQGVITTTHATDNRYTTLGVAEASQVLGSAGGTFGGISVDASAVLIKYTYGGDANLDGKVNIDDYGRIDANVGRSGVVFGWYNGDFNFDGKINIDDYGIIDSIIGAQGPVL